MTEICAHIKALVNRHSITFLWLSLLSSPLCVPLNSSSFWSASVSIGTVSTSTYVRGLMANHREASLCVLVFLASISGCVLGLGSSQIHVLNEKNDISFHSLVTFENTSAVSIPPGTTQVHLSNGAAWDYAVPTTTANILTTFDKVNVSGNYYQNVFTWSHVQTPWISCTTNCSWQVDEHGFSLADVADGGRMKFIVSWDGPYRFT